MRSNGPRLPLLITATILALLAACTPAAVPTVVSTAAPTATPAPPTLPPTPPACTEAVIWPQLAEVQPAEVQPGGEVIVIASGGYLRCGDSYNESARNFALTFDGQPSGSLACYVNRCEARLVVPPEAAPGAHVIAVEGGSEIVLDVGS